MLPSRPLVWITSILLPREEQPAGQQKGGGGGEHAEAGGQRDAGQRHESEQVGTNRDGSLAAKLDVRAQREAVAALVDMAPTRGCARPAPRDRDDNPAPRARARLRTGRMNQTSGRSELGGTRAAGTATALPCCSVSTVWSTSRGARSSGSSTHPVAGSRADRPFSITGAVLHHHLGWGPRPRRPLRRRGPQRRR